MYVHTSTLVWDRDNGVALYIQESRPSPLVLAALVIYLIWKRSSRHCCWNVREYKFCSIKRYFKVAAKTWKYAIVPLTLMKQKTFFSEILVCDFQIFGTGNGYLGVQGTNLKVWHEAEDFQTSAFCNISSHCIKWSEREAENNQTEAKIQFTFVCCFCSSCYRSFDAEVVCHVYERTGVSGRLQMLSARWNHICDPAEWTRSTGSIL